MPVPLRPPYVATCTRHFRRVRGAAGNWMRLILAAALFSTSVTVLLTHKLHLPLPMVSRVPPSTLFASEDSYSQYSVVPLINSSSSTSIANFDMRSVEVTNSDVGHTMQISSRPEVAFWALPPDEALLYAKREVEHAPLVIDDPDLYAPVYWNLSIFKRCPMIDHNTPSQEPSQKFTCEDKVPERHIKMQALEKYKNTNLSYELMERILKIYIYPDGTKPIFHTPELHGIYASEGWFMKLIEQNRRFVVKDPKKAHLFYLPYSSRQLRDAVYIPGSHNLRPLAIFLRDYVNNISSKYPFWNRTRGLDHFLVACHDWGPYSTTLHTELYKNTIKALCNADISEGIFIRGKDVSLPETTIKVPKRPLKYIGGKRVSQRPILAFYAGLMHGRVRPILERLWGNDTEGDIRIFRRLPNRVSRNMSYIEHMKSSRFCICPMGYEVNSPRIVEAIYYECVPVIIADNFVLPFEEVLNWSTFSVVIEEKDIANLKNILLSIPLRRYLKMQKCVQRVQKHFLWHVRPEKYDLFHMLLHSIWFSRLNQFSNSQ